MDTGFSNMDPEASSFCPSAQSTLKRIADNKQSAFMFWFIVIQK
jgi:hypothetical protein